MDEYNPIVRTFNRLRAAILARTDTPRCRIRPEATLESVIPPERRREVWAECQVQGLDVPVLSDAEMMRGCVSAVGIVALVAAQIAWGGLWLLLIVPLVLLIRWVVREPLVPEMPTPARTVGELAVYCTHFPSHRNSGHRWTRNEIEMKIKFVLVEALNVSMEDIRPDSRLWADLGAE
jgi:hypothetical protein